MKALLLVSELEDYTISFASGVAQHLRSSLAFRAGATHILLPGSIRLSICTFWTGHGTARVQSLVPAPAHASHPARAAEPHSPSEQFYALAELCRCLLAPDPACDHRT